jgi:lipopolysaccharide transport system ATP-binding protein
MKKSEINQRFDEIVDFSGVEKFIDTPIKRYSSGMMVRLGFAVAAHMEPEVLIIDEVLAVGDVRFQKRCNEAMKQTASSGRTVILVSHNMAVVSGLCQSGILLDEGKISKIGSIDDVVEGYILDSSSNIARGKAVFDGDNQSSIRVTDLSTLNKDGGISSHFARDSSIIIRVKGEVADPSENNTVAIDVHSSRDQLLFRTHSFEQSNAFAILQEEGKFTLECAIPSNLLPPGTYRIGLKTVAFGKYEIQSAYPVLEFDVIQNELLGNMLIGIRGVLTPACTWTKVTHAY